MAGPFFQKNLDAIRSLNPEQAKTIEDLSPKVEDRLYATKPHGEEFTNLYYPSDTASTFSLFSTQTPGSEIRNWLQSTELLTENPHSVILLGFDLGYYPAKTLELLSPEGILAIVEPDPILFFTAIHLLDLSGLLSDKRVHLFVGQKINKAVESIGEELQWMRFLTLSYKILVAPLLRKCLRNYPKDFTVFFRNALQRELMYRKSRIEHGTTVVFNTIQNSEALIESPGVNVLFDRFSHVPAILAAAGPSLEKNIESIKKISNQAVIACVNSAYPILRRHGVVPHIVFTMDHQERNFRSFQDDCDQPNSFLIADPRINHQVIRHFMPNVFFASWRSSTEIMGDPQPLGQIPVPKMSGNAIYMWLQELTGEKGDVYGPGSVAVVGFHILARMGCTPIILAGQDLAFTDNKTYAGGTIFDDKNLPQDAEAAHYVRSTDGGMVPTSETLYLYRQLLEHEIARFSIPVINCSSGAVINGTITSTIESLLPQMPPMDLDFCSMLAELHEAYPSRVIFRDLQAKLRQGISLLEKFCAVAKRTLDKVPDNPVYLSNQEKSYLLSEVKNAISVCSTEHQSALELLNELLQESHYEFEESQWRRVLVTNENTLLDEEIHSCVRVLDAFVRQATFLSTLFEEKLNDIG